MEVRIAQLSDLPAIQVLHQRLCEGEREYCSDQPIDFSFSEEGRRYLEERARSPRGYLAVAEIDDQPVGLIVGNLDMIDEQCACIEGLYTAPDYRGRGVARLLLNSCLIWAEGLSVRSMTSAALVGNSSALRMYSGFGFSPIERRGNTIVMQRLLDARRADRAA